MVRSFRGGQRLSAAAVCIAIAMSRDSGGKNTDFLTTDANVF